MKPEEIKIGGVYDVRVKVMKKIPVNSLGNLEIGAYTVDRTTQLPMEHEMSWFLTEESAAFTEITPEDGIKNSEPAPKYDPCRLFKKGDLVRVVEWNGRNYYDIDHNTRLETGCLAEISCDEEAEQQEGYVSVIFQEYIRYVPPCFLDLVTPVEELEPWVIDEGDPHFWGIVKIAGKFPVMLPRDYYTREQAEAECARLNAEHRKELK